MHSLHDTPAFFAFVKPNEKAHITYIEAVKSHFVFRAKSELLLLGFLFRITPMNILQNVRSWNRARKTHKALSGLSDRQLDDIGVARAGISSVARNPHLI